MANRTVPKEKIDSKTIRLYLKKERISLNKLSSLIGYSERTIRRGLESELMTSWLIDLIAEKTGLSRDEIVRT